MTSSDKDAMPRSILNEERRAVLHQLEDFLETPMLVLGFVWLALLVIELTGNLSPRFNSSVAQSG